LDNLIIECDTPQHTTSQYIYYLIYILCYTNYKMENENRICQNYGKTLRLIGINRENGKTDHSEQKKTT